MFVMLCGQLACSMTLKRTYSFQQPAIHKTSRRIGSDFVCFEVTLSVDSLAVGRLFLSIFVLPIVVTLSFRQGPLDVRTRTISLRLWSPYKV